jgi:drug/metabolite transporter (DMT)-like permease
MNPVKKFFQSHHRLAGSVVSMGALAVAAIYFVVIPEQASRAEGLVKVLLLYGHGLCWLLIAMASMLWAINKNNRWSPRLLYVALAVYAAFLISMFV